MALESITALNFAGNIVQFIDTGVRLFSKSRKLYKSSNGVLLESAELEIIATSIKKLSEQLTTSPPPQHQRSLETSGLILLALGCNTVAEELLNALEKLRIRGTGRRKWQSFRVALSLVWKSGDIEDMARRLDLLSKQLTTCMIFTLHTEHSSVSASLEQLVRANWQRDSQGISQFEALRHDGLQTLKELRQIREANEETLQKDREYSEKKLQAIGKLHSKVLEEDRECTDKTLRNWEQRDLAVTESFVKLSSKLDHISDLAWKSTTEYRILDSLSNMGMTARYERIADAHAKTFEWIFQDYRYPWGSHYGDTFTEWLSRGTGIFWVTGKAGSGKSTLMKFLSNHRLTSKALKHWSGTKKLVIASFYFWYAGTGFQKSQDGLLRSLLYEIFKQCPDLMPIILPQHWDRTSRSSYITWPRSELIAVFNRLALHTRLTSVFCFFIDGLDEYDGDHNEMISLIRGFTKSENIKWCVSSRPWNVFKAAFGNGSHPSFQLENLTKEDITVYVCDELEGNEAFRNLKRQERTACATLVDEIVEKANGVFLWVFLVVRSLTSGLQNADRIMDLQRRLRRFPSDLEEYFHHMLNNIDDNYLQQTAQTFLLAMEASEPLNLMTYAMVDELEFDSSYALNLGIQQMSSADIISKHSEMKLRINARCKDLLEVTPVRRYTDSYKSLPSFYEYQVDFIHRTVRDFLHLKEIYERVLEHISCGFDVAQSLCAAFLAQVKTIPVQSVDFREDGQLLPLVDGMMYYARQIESRTNTSPTRMLESFYDVVRHRYWALEHSSDILIGEPGHRSLIDAEEITVGSLRTSLKLLCYAPVTFSAHRGLQLYVTNKMDDRQGDLSLYGDESQLYFSAISPYKMPDNDYNMLSVLFSKGVSPPGTEAEPEYWKRVCCEVYRSWLEKARSLKLLHTSITHVVGPREFQWVMYVLKALRRWLHANNSFIPILSETIETFLRRGVNPNWVYGKHSLWTYFTVCLYEDSSFRHRCSPDSKECVLRVVKAFYRRGASRSQIIMHEAIDNTYIIAEEIQSIPDVENIQYKNQGDISQALTAHAAIESFISAEEMQELVFAGKKNTSKRTARKRWMKI